MLLVNERGERRATVPFGRLEELWFMWSRCNLACTHCYVGSSPRNDSLEMLTLDDVRLFLAPVERIYFTGGEPFVNPEILPMLRASLEVAPVTVLSNAVGPIERHIDALPDVTLRVSLDHFDEARHDAIRGRGTFARTVRNVRRLLDRGLRVIITSTPVVFEETPVTRDEAEAAYLALFDGRVEVKILPATLAMGSELARRPGRARETFLTSRHMAGANPRDFQCHYGRAVQKIGGQVRVLPCPILYGEKFALGSTLEESFGPTPMAHPACAQFCWRARGKCG